jgi:hypothetical protein
LFDELCEAFVLFGRQFGFGVGQHPLAALAEDVGEEEGGFAGSR